MRKLQYQTQLPRLNYTQEEYDLLIEFMDQQRYECATILADHIRKDMDKDMITDALDLVELFNWIKEDLESAKSMVTPNENT